MIERLKFWWNYRIRRRCIFCNDKATTRALGVRCCLMCAYKVQGGWDSL